MEELNAKKEEELNAKKEEELNAKKEEELNVRWSWLGEVEEEENSVGTLTVPTASELFSLEAEKTRKEKEEGRRREKRRRRRVNKSLTDVLRERRRGGGGRRWERRRRERKNLQVRSFLFNFTDVTLALEDDKSPISPLLE